MDIRNDEPKLSVNVHRRTTQLNLWMIVALVVFFVLAGLYVLRVFHHPPKSVQDGGTQSSYLVRHRAAETA